jgi:hypothetical protein
MHPLQGSNLNRGSRVTQWVDTLRVVRRDGIPDWDRIYLVESGSLAVPKALGAAGSV